jgi:hypothetical protein
MSDGIAGKLAARAHTARTDRPHAADGSCLTMVGYDAGTVSAHCQMKKIESTKKKVIQRTIKHKIMYSSEEKLVRKQDDNNRPLTEYSNSMGEKRVCLPVPEAYCLH